MKLSLLPTIIFPLVATAMVTPKLPAGLEKRQAVSYLDLFPVHTA